ncbi:MAG: glycosyl transferase [Rhodobacteraceae bacterium]|nr:glycosyl transferase [Paracoccaceae bacterium]
MKQVICINWGTRYGAPYINRLYSMVARNITPPFRFVAFTDTTDSVLPDVECFPLPEMPGYIPENTPGKWQKARLWAAQLADLTGNLLFIDLDVIITDSLEPFFDHGDPEDLYMAWNVARPLNRLGQSSIYRVPVGQLAPLQEIYAKDPQGVADKYRYEQHFVTANAPRRPKFWPRAWVRHFRIECIPTMPMNFIKPPRLRNGTRVVIFAGTPDLPEAIKGCLSTKHPVMTPGEYLRYWRRNRLHVRKLQDYALPAPWIKDFWKI